MQNLLQQERTEGCLCSILQVVTHFVPEHLNLNAIIF
jgi:hypothetical protein